MIHPKAGLSVFDAASIAIGVVVGIGIFRAPSVVATHANSEAGFLLFWILGGALSLIGALVYAELGSSHPDMGGEYHFLTKAYGKKVGFFFGWGRLSVIQTGAIATVAFVLGDYMSQLLPLGNFGPPLYAALAVTALTILNLRGIKPSRWFQNTFTLFTLLLIFSLVAFGLLSPITSTIATESAGPSAPSLGAAMIFVLLTFGGWNEAVYLSAEVTHVQKNLVRSLIIGISVVIVAYLLLNLAYLKVLGLEGIRGSDAVAADMLGAIVGERGSLVISLVIAVASLSTLNATIFTGSRSNTAFGRDFHAFRWLGHWQTSSGMPGNSLLAQGLVALALIAVGAVTREGFVTMVEYTAPAFWFFFLLSAMSIFILRRKNKKAPAFKAPFYPFLPIIFCLSCAYMLYASLVYTGLGALLGVMVMLLGLPVSWILEGAPFRRPHKIRDKILQ